MQPFRRGRVLARLAGSEADLDRVLSLRARAFGRGPGVSDRDGFDDLCRHVMIETAEGALALCYRVLLLPSGAALGQSYAGGFYDLAPLAFWPGPVAEMGRFCLDPAHADADALRLAWAAMTRIVDGAGAGLMTGCTSFPGTDWRPHRAALALLAAGHLGPAPLRPGHKAAEVVHYPALAGPLQDRRAALAGLPPLLRSYLGMGGWVSDHAVVDRALDTLHVFTCVAVGAVPAARAASLRAIAGG